MIRASTSQFMSSLEIWQFWFFFYRERTCFCQNILFIINNDLNFDTQLCTTFQYAIYLWTSFNHLPYILGYVKAIRLSDILCNVAAETGIAHCYARRGPFTLFLTGVPFAKIDLSVSTTLRTKLGRYTEWEERGENISVTSLLRKIPKNSNGDLMHFYAFQSV